MFQSPGGDSLWSIHFTEIEEDYLNYPFQSPCEDWCLLDTDSDDFPGFESLLFQSPYED
jgi:hypothetical protein